MNPSHVMATGGVTAMLAAFLHWATTWPLQPMDENTSMAVAGLIVSILGAWGVARLNKSRAGNGAVPPTQQE